MKAGTKRRKRNHGEMRQSSIHDVARAAGVSIATASRAINRVSTVDPALSERVLNAVRQVGYVRNTQARALVSGRSRLFGVIISDITNPFFPELIDGFEERAVSMGYETMIGSTGYDPAKMAACIDRMLERKVDGVAVMTFGLEPPQLSRLRLKDVPTVLVDAPANAVTTSSVEIDYRTGIFEAVQHLSDLGHRRIAFIAGPREIESAQRRLDAVCAAMKELGLRLRDEYLYVGNHTLEQGQTATEHLLKQTARPTAILCSNDMTAIGAMHALSNAGLAIPRDMSLVGFDDIRLTQYMVPPLTTIRMSGREIAHAAVDQLRSLVEDKASLSRTISTSLVVRRSTSTPAIAQDDAKPRRKRT